VSLTGQTITGATLTFSSISNWDATPNMLFIHLLDSAKNAGAASFVDAPLNQTPVTGIAITLPARSLTATAGGPRYCEHAFNCAKLYYHANYLCLHFHGAQLQALNAYFSMEIT